nr:ATP synthase F0 subunit 6 [Neohydatothrips samayunkur]
MMVPLSLMFLPFYKKSTRLMIFYKKMNQEISSQLEISLKTKSDGSKMIFVCLFSFIVLCNLLGLVPNFFTPTSHMTTNLFLSFPLWMGILIFGWCNYTNKMLAHLVPLGTPNMLISFMVLIEMISTLIRPLTLSIRLMANMVSGHLLMTLMGNYMVPCSIFIIFIIVILQTMLFLLESGVALIQAYVFCMLMSLYSDESEYKN